VKLSGYKLVIKDKHSI